MNSDPAILRILDANANRAREALRVMEDFARFALDDAALNETLKHLRHDLAAALAKLPMEHALQTRDTPGDVGVDVKTAAEFHRPALRDVATANAKRLSEALRSLEEAAKIINADAAATLEKLRYRGYSAEQALKQSDQRLRAVERFRAVRLCVLLTESLCGTAQQSVPWEMMLDRILAAVPRIAGEPSPLAVQLREKNLPDAELLRRATIVVQKCHHAGALAIINDRPDIARLSSADGVHLGQTDLPIDAARCILGPRAMIGVSTESLDQARAAAAATYIAVGPMFPTTTKEKPRIAGPAYAAAAAQEIATPPLIAIGGITPENIGAVIAAGVRRVAVSSAVLRADQPDAAVRALIHALHQG